ncbi:hypothetical protein ACFOLD_07870 [Kocuria carniphila]|uniref:hypothetical protein n=1 Tax=Kocuria carniphila TaxID=262208 RepID=UPI00360CFDF1
MPEDYRLFNNSSKGLFNNLAATRTEGCTAAWSPRPLNRTLATVEAEFGHPSATLKITGTKKPLRLNRSGFLMSQSYGQQAAAHHTQRRMGNCIG